MMLRGSNLVLRKQFKALFSTYFGKKVYFQKFCCAACAPRGFLKFLFLRKMVVNVPCLVHFEPVNASKASQLVTVISQSLYMLILSES